MEVNIRDPQKIVEVWLSGNEKDDPRVQARLTPLYDRYRQKKYTVAVYLSGTQELYDRTLGLLSYNKRRIAELEEQ